MSKIARFSLSLVLAALLSTPVVAVPRDRDPGDPVNIIKKIVRLLKGVLAPNDEGMIVPRP